MRRPIFWFIWPASPQGPVDDDAVQAQWSRVCARGPWRSAFLIAATAGVITAVASAVSTTLAQLSLLAAGLTLLVAVPLVALLARAWVAGTYVNDSGVKVSRVLTTQVVPWGAITAVGTVSGSCLLGAPLRLHGQRVVLRTAEASVGTHVESMSPDLWLRPEAWSAARDRLSTWWTETRASEAD